MFWPILKMHKNINTRRKTMTTEITLTDKQRDLLHLAATKFFGNALPAAGQVGLHGGAYDAVSMKLKNLGFLEGENSSLWHLTEAAYEFLGIKHKRHEPKPIAEAEPSLEVALFEAFGGEATLAMGSAPACAVSATQEAAEPVTPPEQPTPKQRKLRDGTKQAQVINMLRRPEGASLQQIMEATDWQMHTARSVLSRTIQKDLGIALTSEKVSGNERIYRVGA
jgi:hypothetical protein